jgi:TRAP transporter TAXI family solute receptor
MDRAAQCMQLSPHRRKEARMKSTAVTAALFLLPCVAHAQQIGIGTMGQGTLGYSIGAAIAKVIADKSDLRPRVQPAAGTSAYLPLLNGGEIDFGIANVMEAKEAAAGSGPFAGRRQENLRVVGVLFPFRVGFFVRRDSGLRTVADLKGKRVTYGYTAQLSIKDIADGYLANGGLSPADVTPVLVPNVVRGAQDFIAGKADAAFFAIGAGQVQEANASVGGIRFLQMSDAPAALAAMHKLVPEAYITIVMPRAGLAGVEEPTKTMAYDYLLLTGRHARDETVAKVVDLLAGNREALVEAFAGFALFDPQRMAKRQPVEYHPGAIAAFTKRGQWPPQ